MCDLEQFSKIQLQILMETVSFTTLENSEREDLDRVKFKISFPYQI